MCQHDQDAPISLLHKMENHNKNLRMLAIDVSNATIA